ncbi:hypothetical protein I302_105405 [Kwoniella bestiolae CBS 10118]|uniref:Uncharacterized protein n=1 Tax=Kwoniella bestiolae CBS 10118 TaxID=1296100 RepID=A0A1B9FT08_9TREE|nr:hypothetical protein I302_08686 [Kwoniella bestiolae CBS 10118]OCF21907.1 hypothetical protein I302_08686 [Kwoniella bestiolae CBS 10118]
MSATTNTNPSNSTPTSARHLPFQAWHQLPDNAYVVEYDSAGRTEFASEHASSDRGGTKTKPSWVRHGTLYQNGGDIHLTDAQQAEVKELRGLGYTILHRVEPSTKGRRISTWKTKGALTDTDPVISRVKFSQAADSTQSQG